MQYIYPLEAICPTRASSSQSRHKISPAALPEIREKRKTKSLRQLAQEYGVSHEAVRSALKANFATSKQDAH